MTAGSPFDGIAAVYDETFTNTTLGRIYRRAVWRRLDALFYRGSRILELNCGTGEDALYLASKGVCVIATDASEAMLEQAAGKARERRLNGAVRTAYLNLADFSSRRALDLLESYNPPFDGALSNFGGLNCVADLGAVAEGLASVLRTRAPVVLCLMGRLVPWEWIWYCTRPSKAFRRVKTTGAVWRGIPIYYPTIGAVKKAFSPYFRPTRVAGIGFLLPPPYAEGVARRAPRLLRALDRLERRIEAVPPFAWLADHYLLELEKL
ncbi:MAG: methyltransferase [Gemmatimonadales bacterium]|nr:2-phytyl-1,4-naphtoquinone methyltransferase [bacterium HR33]GIW51535.1 MAG: methyltransferase [Gemmatimonadales bacterium]